jgi:hypothetical protein
MNNKDDLTLKKEERNEKNIHTCILCYSRARVVDDRELWGNSDQNFKNLFFIRYYMKN